MGVSIFAMGVGFHLSVTTTGVTWLQRSFQYQANSIGMETERM